MVEKIIFKHSPISRMKDEQLDEHIWIEELN